MKHQDLDSPDSTVNKFLLSIPKSFGYTLLSIPRAKNGQVMMESLVDD